VEKTLKSRTRVADTAILVSLKHSEGVQMITLERKGFTMVAEWSKTNGGMLYCRIEYDDGRSPSPWFIRNCEDIKDIDTIKAKLFDRLKALYLYTNWGGVISLPPYSPACY